MTNKHILKFLTRQEAEAVSDIRDRWFIYSGASKHITNNSNLFHKMMEVKETVEVGEGTVIVVKGICTPRAEISYNGIVQKIVAEDVPIVPSICKNLLSVSGLRRTDLAVIYSNGEKFSSQRVVSIM